MRILGTVARSGEPSRAPPPPPPPRGRRRGRPRSPPGHSAPPREPAPMRKGRVKQSVVYWCFNARGEKWDAEKTCRSPRTSASRRSNSSAPSTGPPSRSTASPAPSPPNGMPGAPFMHGFNNPQFHAEVVERTGKTIDACADAKFPSVIAFVGYKWPNPDDPKSGEISRDEAFANCVKGLKELAAARREEGRDGLPRTPQHPRRLGPDEGPPRLPGRRPRLRAPRSSARSARRGSSCSSTSTTSR